VEIMHLIEEFESVVEESSRIPMTGKIIIHEDILYNFLDRLRASMPEAVREAEWVIREKERILGEAERESQTIVDTAKSKLQRIAGESEIVKLAKIQGDELIENAKKAAKEITHGSFSYADDVMAQLQVQLEKSMQVVKQGREEIRQNIREKKVKE
jgi:hypothetical protein